MDFTDAELQMIAYYDHGNREKLIRDLRMMRTCLVAEECHMLAVSESVLKKLTAMSTEEYKKLNPYDFGNPFFNAGG